MAEILGRVTDETPAADAARSRTIEVAPPPPDGYLVERPARSAAAPANEVAVLQQVERELNGVLLEREEAVRAALLALLSRSHLVLLGPPGTAKSQLVAAVARRFCDPAGAGLSYFVYLLTRFTTPEELFGPVSVQGLKHDTYARVTIGKLPEAQLAFLDEVFKSSSAVLNSLLELLNNRVYDNGTGRLTVPLISCSGASNELPQGEDLEALWDRFLLRVQVGYLSQSGFDKLLAGTLAARSSAVPTTLSQADLAALQQRAAGLPIPSSVAGALAGLRRDLEQQHGIIASDRRWVQCLKLLQAHALLEGRAAVEEDDLVVLAHVLWSQPEQRADIARLVSRLANPTNAKAAELKDRAAELWDTARGKLRDHGGDDGAAARAQIALEALSKIKKIGRDLDALLGQAREQGRSTQRVEQARAVVMTIHAEIIGSSDL
jgi:MoxR-like ATPase